MIVRNLEGKKALVTGGTRGIGAAIANYLYECGADITITGTKQNHKLKHNYSYECIDFTLEDDLDNFAEHVKTSDFDILINNAGINHVCPFLKLNIVDFKKVQQVNLNAPMILCQSVLPNMVEKKWGRIVNISSIWGKISKSHRAPYSSSKFAIDGLTVSLSAEFASLGILINSVAPGFIDTELTRKNLGADEMNELAFQVPAKRIGSPEEVAKLVGYLSGPDNTYISGQNIAIDGGFTRV
jgi:NAD(P)-dependent dehydrogenase (short-subunit alcohol dehydrogenase family)